MNTNRPVLMAQENNLPAHAPTDEAKPGDGFTLQADLAAARHSLLRLAQDFNAYQEQLQKQIPRRDETEMDALMREILPIVDHLEAALDSATSDRYMELRQDVKIALHRLYRLLQNHDIELTDDLGQPFDPLQHELVAEGCDPAKPENTVLLVKECGYRRNNDVFRPAKVVVNVLAKPQVGDGS